MRPSDAGARQTALDPERSFIVQAPAGSGKTELLIQRYLTLLAAVDEPEQIVAITFTRKAAAEMRARIADALEAAAAGAAPQEPHRAATHVLAAAALERDAARGWMLRSQPQRMRIDTLDALNVWLARRLPVLSGAVAAATIEERPDELYARAARRTVDRVGASDETGRALRRLLGLLDNALPRLESLIAALLPKRDQWLGHLLGRSEDDLRAGLERALDALVGETLADLKAAWPGALSTVLVDSLEHAAAHTDNEAVRAGAAAAADDGPQARTAERLTFWRGVAALLLTGRGDWRRRLTKAQGFRREDGEAKTRALELLAELAGNELLRSKLERVSRLPDPHYGDGQWRDLLALRSVLVRAVAELRVAFAARQSVDFVELALAAQQALGRVDAPSELLLALDRRIQHILVDEFQDTSKTQFRLLELLTAGWQRDDGRSLLLVGDPMQSIYRFRDADMSLFAHVKAHGIGDVRCELLQLEANFRSAPAVVSWVNEAFAPIFGAPAAPDHAQAEFHPSHAERPPGTDQAVSLHAIVSNDESDELARVMRVLEAERARAPRQSIAVLVQSRSHLAGLHGHLLARGWPVHALEIDAVSESQCGQDLLGLTRALAHLGDRVAWLAVLRAPWCGLTWDDLERLCGDHPRRTIWELIHDGEILAKLSAQGQERLAAVRAVLDDAFERRARMRFAHWVEACWHALDGPACVAARDVAIAEQFFARLAELSSDDGPIEPATLEHAFSTPAAQPRPRFDGGIEIMTIHRAKGLEFDTVVLFGLGRAPRRDDPQALYWLERTGAAGPELLLAPIQRDEDALGRLLRRHEEAAEDAERARVLYVAATRAKERLHLVCRLLPGKTEPPSRSLLSWLWPAFGGELLAEAETVESDGDPEPPTIPPLVRLASPAFGRITARAVDAAPARPMRPEFEWAGQTATRVGTVVHAELLAISERGLEVYARSDRALRLGRYARRLALRGVEPKELDAAAERVATAIDRVLEDPRGRWILAARREAQSELRLSLRSHDGLRHLQLDRTFVDDDGVRWIVDYKTSDHEGADLEGFLDSEVERYRGQLETYAAAMAELDAGRPMRVALYFPLLQAFRDWVPTAIRSRTY